jgi:putative IMPACT (imprinted ancient) family translation regulator
MIAHAERSGDRLLSYEEFLDANENEEIDNSQFVTILESFTQSKEVSKVIQLPNEPKDADKKKVKKLPLVKPVS